MDQTFDAMESSLNQTFNALNSDCSQPLAHSTMLPHLNVDPRDIHDSQSQFWDLSDMEYSTFGDSGDSDENADALLSALEETEDQVHIEHGTFNVPNVHPNGTYNKPQSHIISNNQCNMSNGLEQSVPKNVLFHVIEERTPCNEVVKSTKKFVQSPTEGELWEAIDQLFPDNKSNAI